MGRLLAKDVANQTAIHPTGFATSEAVLYCLSGGFSIILVLVGGLFAGLTLAYVSLINSEDDV